jgi:hypothetical protein
MRLTSGSDTAAEKLKKLETQAAEAAASVKQLQSAVNQLQVE